MADDIEEGKTYRADNFRDAMTKRLKKSLEKQNRQRAASKRAVGEEFEQVDEISKKKLNRYAYAADRDISRTADDLETVRSAKKRDKLDHRIQKRHDGLNLATNKMGERGGTPSKIKATEEFEQIDEIGDTPEGRRALGSYIRKAARKTSIATTINKGKDKDYVTGYIQKRLKGIGRAGERVQNNEEVEQIDELSRKTLGDYYRKSTTEIDKIADRNNRKGDRLSKTTLRKFKNRSDGASLAFRKQGHYSYDYMKPKVMAKEEVELDEASSFKVVHASSGQLATIPAGGNNLGGVYGDRKGAEAHVKAMKKRHPGHKFDIIEPTRKEEVELDEGINAYKAKSDSGLSGVIHFEHPDGSSIKLHQGPNTHFVHHDGKTGAKKKFQSLDALKKHIDGVKEETDIEESKTVRADPDHIRSSLAAKRNRKLADKAYRERAGSKRAIGEEAEEIEEGNELVVGQKVRVTNPKAKPKYTVLALSKNHVKIRNHAGGRDYKLRRDRIERVNKLGKHAVTEEVEQVEEGLKLIKTHGTGSKVAKVYKDSEWDEYHVKHYTDGKHHAKADYHTDDKDDAHGTAKHWIKEGVELDEAKNDIHSHIKKLAADGYVQNDDHTKHRDGTHTFRRGFFYHHGVDSEKYAGKVSRDLHAAGIKHTVLDHGEKMVPFRGGDSVKQGSHWWVKVKPHEPVKEEAEQVEEGKTWRADAGAGYAAKKAIRDKIKRFNQTRKDGKLKKVVNEDLYPEVRSLNKKKRPSKTKAKIEPTGI